MHRLCYKQLYFETYQEPLLFLIILKELNLGSASLCLSCHCGWHME